MAVDRRYFDNLLADRRMSLRQLASRMGMTHSQLSLTFSGARRMQLDEAAKLARMFGVPLHQIAVAAGVAEAGRAGKRCPVVGIMRGDGVVSDNEETERTTAPDSLPDDVVAIQARTAGSPMAWVDGWVFFCQPLEKMSNGPVSAMAAGRFCLVRLKGGRQVLATIRRGYAEGRYALSGPYVDERAVIEAATPVLVTRH